MLDVFCTFGSVLMDFQVRICFCQVRISDPLPSSKAPFANKNSRKLCVCVWVLDCKTNSLTSQAKQTFTYIWSMTFHYIMLNWLHLLLTPQNRKMVELLLHPISVCKQLSCASQLTCKGVVQTKPLQPSLVFNLLFSYVIFFIFIAETLISYTYPWPASCSLIFLLSDAERMIV